MRRYPVVSFLQVRFAPQLHCGAGLQNNDGIETVLAAVNRGLQRARDEYNEKLMSKWDTGAPRKGNREPYYEYGIIVCAMRKFFPGMSRYVQVEVIFFWSLYIHHAGKCVWIVCVCV